MEFELSLRRFPRDKDCFDLGTLGRFKVTASVFLICVLSSVFPDQFCRIGAIRETLEFWKIIPNFWLNPGRSGNKQEGNNRDFLKTFYSISPIQTSEVLTTQEIDKAEDARRRAIET